MSQAPYIKNMIEEHGGDAELKDALKTPPSVGATLRSNGISAHFLQSLGIPLANVNYEQLPALALFDDSSMAEHETGRISTNVGFNHNHMDLSLPAQG